MTITAPLHSPTRMIVRSGHALAAAGALGPTLSVFAYKALAPLFFIVAVVELAVYWQKHRRLPAPQMIVATLFGSFVLWGVIGTAWSLDADASLMTAGKICLMAVLGLPLVAAGRELGADDRRLVLRATRGGAVAGLAFMAVEVFFHLPLTHALYTLFRLPHAVYPSMLNPAATVLVLVSAITVGDLLRRHHGQWALAVGVAAIGLAVMSESMAAGLAGMIAALALVLVYWGGTAMGWCLAAVSALLILAAPLLPDRALGPVKEFHWPTGAVPSVYQRIAIWKFTESQIDVRPVLGWGLDAARRIPGGHDGIKAESLDIQDPLMQARVAAYFHSGNIEQMPLHPHNAALQIWLEAGVVGAVLTALLVLTVLGAIAGGCRKERYGAAASFALALSTLIEAGLSYGIWQTWWVATLWLTAALAAVLLEAPGKAVSSTRSSSS